ncbi:hypothetical protein [Hyphomicrobium sp.]|uniref:hypothetical protein n=1 Tax=Hyphomicrobium sp. TaxID=82 RepID=UPI003F6FB017
MATVVNVHGTFVHSAGTADALNINPDAPVQWWQQGSTFEHEVKSYVTGEDGPVDVVPFTWRSQNSEIDRRQAGSALLETLRGLDKKGEPYVVVGHSHGGSVIASALIESVSRRRPLVNLKRWITIGTPFVGMRKERFLFSRLTLTRKVIFVASLMLALMFLFYVMGELFTHGFQARSDRYYTALLFNGVMMTLPILFSYIVFRFFDGRELKGYSGGTVARARTSYAGKWLPISHKNDEAVQGLRMLPGMKLHFFDDGFAASTITKAAVIALPLVYLFAVTSPTIMLGISDFLQTRIYDVQEFVEEDGAATKAREELRNFSGRMREYQEQADQQSGLNPAAAEEARQRAAGARRELREKRRQLEQSFPEFNSVERAQRFKRRFLQRAGQPCEGGRLCGGGHDYALNSKLLFHVVTDELSSAVIDDGVVGGRIGGLLRLLIPVILVPLAFAVIALVMLKVIEYLAQFVSKVLARGLNKLTLAEMKRSTFGNDTEGEIVVGADYGPSWLDPVTWELPADVADRISAHSNAMASQSIAKFREAISTLSYAEGEDARSKLISNYLTWNELVHTSYFEVPEFRKMVALAISQAPGFRPTENLLNDVEYQATVQWVAVLGQPVVIGDTPGIMVADVAPQVLGAPQGQASYQA